MAGRDGFDSDGNEFFASGQPAGQRTGKPAGDTEELSLTNEDDRLPWLESGDYDDDDDANGVDTGRIVGFALLGLLALAVLAGGVWFISNRTSNSEFVADGSVIKAPPGPVKERPENPGGKTFAGTGNVAPGVGEGKVSEGRLAKTPESAAPAKPAPAADSPPQPAAPVGVGVQVGAYSTRESAQRGWEALSRQTDAIAGFSYRIVEGKADIGTVYRLQAVTGDRTSAKALCNALRNDGLACQVK